MRRFTILLVAALLAAALLAGSAGIAGADPGMNQVTVTAACDDGERYTFVLNGESNSGHIVGSESEFVAVWYEAAYYSPGDLENPIATDRFDRGTKNGLLGDLISCETETTFEHWQLGTVTAIVEFQGFVTPRGES